MNDVKKEYLLRNALKEACEKLAVCGEDFTEIALLLDYVQITLELFGISSSKNSTQLLEEDDSKISMEKANLLKYLTIQEFENYKK